jgi:hypothetical protein
MKNLINLGFKWLLGDFVKLIVGRKVILIGSKRSRKIFCDFLGKIQICFDCAKNERKLHKIQFKAPLKNSLGFSTVFFALKVNFPNFHGLL